MIDFTPGSPGGQLSWIVVGWLVGGLFGVGFRIWLLFKYVDDLRFSIDNHATPRRVSVSWRRITSSTLHLTAKSIIVAIGIAAAHDEWYNPATTGVPFAVATVGLLIIPWLLTLDGFLEFWQQRGLLASSKPSKEADRLFTREDIVG